MSVLAFVIVLAAPPPSEPTHQGRPLSAWVGDLASPDEATALKAIHATAAMGKAARSATPHLVTLGFVTGRDRERLRTPARDALKQIRLPSVEELMARLPMTSGTDRLLLLRLLALHGPNASPATKLLIVEVRHHGWDPTKLTRDHVEISTTARTALEQIGAPAVGELLEAGIQAEHEGRGQDTLLLAGILTRIGEPAILALSSALSSETHIARWFAVKGLGTAANSGRISALGPLRQAARSSDPIVRRYAREMLENVERFLPFYALAAEAASAVAAGAAGSLHGTTGLLRIPGIDAEPAPPPPPPAPTSTSLLAVSRPTRLLLVVGLSGFVLGSLLLLVRVMRPKADTPASDEPARLSSRRLGGDG